MKWILGFITENPIFDKNVRHPEDGGSKVFRYVGILPHHYMASQLRAPRPGLQ